MSRRKGAGRKPQGEFSKLSAHFAVRMPQDLRDQLQAAADKAGRSASQELLWRLRWSFASQGQDRRNKAARAFCFLFLELRDYIGVATATEQWHRNPFVFRAFKLAVSKLLDRFSPPGEIGAPLRAPHKTWKSPATVANVAVSRVLDNLYRDDVNTPSEVELAFSVMSKGRYPQIHDIAGVMLERAKRTRYGMADVRRDLNIKGGIQNVDS